MRHLANIDSAELNSTVDSDIRRIFPHFAGVGSKYFHYLFEPAKFCEQLDFFVDTGYEITMDDPLMTILSYAKEYDDGKHGRAIWTEHAIIYKKFGIVFYTDNDEEFARSPKQVANAVLEYLEGRNANNGWI